MSDRREGRGRRSRLGNFRQGADGKYVYAGAHYVCRSDRPFGRYLAYVWIASAISFLSAVAGGCIGAPGMRGCAYLIIPYLVELALAGSIVWASFRLSEGGRTSARLRIPQCGRVRAEKVYRISCACRSRRTVRDRVPDPVGERRQSYIGDPFLRSEGARNTVCACAERHCSENAVGKRSAAQPLLG